MKRFNHNFSGTCEIMKKKTHRPQSLLNTLTTFPPSHWNNVGFPKSSEAPVITDLAQTGDLTPEKQLSTSCKRQEISGHVAKMWCSFA